MAYTYAFTHCTPAQFQGLRGVCVPVLCVGYVQVMCFVLSWRVMDSGAAGLSDVHNDVVYVLFCYERSCSVLFCRMSDSGAAEPSEVHNGTFHIMCGCYVWVMCGCYVWVMCGVMCGLCVGVMCGCYVPVLKNPVLKKPLLKKPWGNPWSRVRIQFLGQLLDVLEGGVSRILLVGQGVLGDSRSVL